MDYVQYWPVLAVLALGVIVYVLTRSSKTQVSVAPVVVPDVKTPCPVGSPECKDDSKDSKDKPEDKTPEVVDKPKEVDPKPAVTWDAVQAHPLKIVADVVANEVGEHKAAAQAGMADANTHLLKAQHLETALNTLKEKITTDVKRGSS